MDCVLVSISLMSNRDLLVVSILSERGLQAEPSIPCGIKEKDALLEAIGNQGEKPASGQLDKFKGMFLS